MTLAAGKNDGKFEDFMNSHRYLSVSLEGMQARNIFYPTTLGKVHYHFCIPVCTQYCTFMSLLHSTVLTEIRRGVQRLCLWRADMSSKKLTRTR